MKKVLSLVLAALMVLSLSVVAFAQTVEEDNTTPGTAGGPVREDGKLDLGIGDLADPAGEDPDKPGATYYYTIMVYDEDGDAWSMLTNDDYAEHLSVTIKERGDAMIDAYSIVKHNGVYKVKVETKEFYTVSAKEADWTIRILRNKKYEVLEAVVSICQDWAQESNTTDVDFGEELSALILNAENEEAPGYSFDMEYTDDANEEGNLTINKAIKYYEIFFDATPVWYSGKNVAKQEVNVRMETSPPKALATTYEDADLEYLTILGKPEFDTKGTLHVSVEDDMFVYGIYDGKLVDVFEWNKETECWEYATKKVEGVLISDIELDLSVYNATIGGDDDKDNPGTGSVDFVNVAVALGVVSLAAAGAVALKK